MARDPQLDKLIADMKTKQFRDGEAKGLVATIGDEIKKQLSPLFEAHSKEMTSKVSDAFSQAVKGLKIDAPTVDTPQVTVNIPDINIPEFNIPTPKVTVNVPKADTPIVNVPAPVVNFPSEMGLRRDSTPFPVLLTDSKGKPFQFPVSMGASGGKADFFTILGIQNTVGMVTVNPDGSPTYPSSSSSSGAVGQGDAATAARVVIAGNSDASVVVNSGTLTAVTSITNSVAATILDESGSPWQPFTYAQGDVATAQRVVIAGNSDASVVVNSGTLTAVTSITNSVAATILDESGSPWQPFVYGAGDMATAQRVVLAGNSDASVVVNSGTLTAVTSITNSVASALVDSSGVAYSGDNPLPITGNITTSAGAVGQGDAATASRVVIAGNSDSSVVVNSGTLTAVTSITNSVASALVDSSGVAYSGSNPLPTSATLAVPDGQGDEASALRVVIAGNSDASVVVNSGTITAVTGITNSVSVVVLDRDGTPQGVGPVAQGDSASAFRVVVAGNSDASVVVNSGTITAVTTITNSVASALVNSTGVQYSGSNPVPVYLVLGSGNSTVSVGPTLHDAVDDGAAPQKVGGTAMQANPTAVAGGDMVRFVADDLGRQLTRPIQVRDLIRTAYVSVTNGTETTLRAAVAGAYLDCVSLMGSNNSDAAVSVDVRCTTAGNVVHTIRIPANSTAGWVPPVPWPQDATGNNWTIDGPDETGRTLTFSALFSQEV